MPSDFEVNLRGVEDRLMKLGLDQILARLAALEQQQWALQGQGGGGFADQMTGLAKVTTLVTAGSTSGPGTGFGDTLTTDGSTYTNLGFNQPLYNNNAFKIAVNDVVQWQINNGLRFVVVPGDCADLS